MGAHASCAGRTMNSRKLSMEYAAAGFTELRLSDEGNGVLSRPGRTEAGRFTPGGLMALFLALALAVAFFGASPAKAEEEFLDPEVAFVLSAATPTPDQIDIHFKIAPKYYMYRERFGFATEPSSANDVLGVPEYPQGIVKYDPTFEKDLEVYHDQVTIRLPLKPGVAQPFTLLVSDQSCADAGLCYPPMRSEEHTSELQS